MKNLIPTLLILATAAVATAAPETLRDPQDLVALAKAQPSGTSMTIPPGIYRVCDLPESGLQFRNWKDAEIEADGVTIILKPGQTISFAGCTNIRLRGLAVDFDPVPWSQGTIAAIDPVEKSVSVKLDDGYPELENLPQRDSMLYFVFDPAKLAPRHLLWEGFRSFDPIGKRLYRLAGPTANGFFGELDSPLGPRPGDKIALFNRGGPAIQITDSANCRMEEVSVFAAPGYAFYESGGEGGHHYLRCRIVRKPESDRILVTAADGLHSYLVRKGPLIEGCEFGDTADDTIAIHGFFSLITGSTRPGTIQLVAPFGPDFEVGDTLRFLEMPHGREIGSSKVTLIRPAKPEEAATPLESLLKDWAKEGFRMRRIPQPKFWTLELEQPVDVPPGRLVLASSPSRCGNGAVVRDTVVRRSHKRGILIKADNVRIEGNTLEDIAGPSILIEPELFWLEGPLPRNISICNNTIARSSWRSLNRSGAVLGLGGAIEIRTRFSRRQFPPQQDPYPLMKDFVIAGNTIHESASYGLVLGNVKGAKVHGNSFGEVFARPGAAESRGLEKAFDAKEHSLEVAKDFAAPPATILVFGSEDVVLSGNIFTPKPPGFTAQPIAVGPWCQDVGGADLQEAPRKTAFNPLPLRVRYPRSSPASVHSAE